MNVGTVVQITLLSRYGSNEFRNVYHYEVSAQTGTPALSDVLLEFAEQVVPAHAGVVVGGTQIYGIQAADLTDEVDYAETSIVPAVDGLRAGDPASMFVALGLTLIRTNRSTRQGAKRISPLSETDLTAGVVQAGLITAANALGAALIAPLEVAAGGAGNATLIPIIYGEALDERPSKRGGTLPARPTVMNPIKGFRVNPQSTSQVSRKVGRGI